MTNDRLSETRVPPSPGLRTCRWCGGQLQFEPQYPVLRLLPGESSPLADDYVPATLRTVAAWVCATPFCKYREKA